MSKLSYKKVFSKYNVTFSSRLDCLIYNLYKKIKTSKFSTLSEEEKSMLDETCFEEEASSAMPFGYNFSAQKLEEGYLNLEYLDIFDFLPKENVDDFKSKLKQSISRNKLSFFSSYFTNEDDKMIDNIGSYMDYFSTSKLCTIELCHNKYLKQYAPRVSISLQNLSTSFLLVKYRFHINKEFNEKVNTTCKSDYPPYSSIVRGVNTSWYQPQRFGRLLYTGNDARAKALYSLISKMKWQAYKELKKWFSINFAKVHLFPPTFETYSTNIRPNNSLENRKFWQSVRLNYHSDYAPKFNICVSMNDECEPSEGMNCSAYCGGGYSSENDNRFKSYQYYISDIYAVYLVANSINYVAKLNLAQGNKQISRAINKAKTASILKVRANVEQNLYYSYRFISEFTGNTIDLSDVTEFHCPSYKDKKGSNTEWRLKGISQDTNISKNNIDALFKILNDAAEYGNSKLNLNIQRLMMLVTFLSLFVAILSMMGFNAERFKSLWDSIVSLFKLV